MCGRNEKDSVLSAERISERTTNSDIIMDFLTIQYFHPVSRNALPLNFKTFSIFILTAYLYTTY